MRVTINLDTSNAAFTGNDDELLDLLLTVAHRIADYGEYNGILVGSNGNTVGEYDVTKRRRKKK
jgi:hypothetical protein